MHVAWLLPESLSPLQLRVRPQLLAGSSPGCPGPQPHAVNNAASCLSGRQQTRQPRAGRRHFFPIHIHVNTVSINFLAKKIGYCNTSGVCHQLSNGFELKHGILSDDEDVKVKPIETSPNLNLDIAPLLAYRPFF